MTKLVFSMIEISVLIASFRLVLDVISLIHSRIRGNKSPKYGLIASALIFEISEMTVKIDDTIIEVDFSPSNFLIKQRRIDVEYAFARSGVCLTNILISLTASSRSLTSCDYSSCEIKLTIIYLRYGKI